MIELNKVYTDGDYFRTPVAVRGDRVVYWLCAFERTIGKEDNTGNMSIEVFEKTHKLYDKPMTFQRIKDEGIKKLISNDGNARFVVGFESSGCLVTESLTFGLITAWRESEIYHWKVAE